MSQLSNSGIYGRRSILVRIRGLATILPTATMRNIVVCSRAADWQVPVYVGSRRNLHGPSICGLALVLSRGRRIEVEAGFDGPTLQRLINLLEKM